MKKKLVKELRKVAAEMPVIMRNSVEKHLVKGSDLIADGIHELPNPDYIPGNPYSKEKLPVVPDRMYIQKYPVRIAINHETKLKNCMKQMGINGVHAYVDAVIKHATTEQ